MPFLRSKHDFPEDLVQAQIQLHETRAEFRAFCDTPPWSTVPAKGWAAREQQYSAYQRTMADTNDWSKEQKQHHRDLPDRLLELSLRVHQHSHWRTYGREQIVDARMTLKRQAVPHR